MTKTKSELTIENEALRAEIETLKAEIETLRAPKATKAKAARWERVVSTWTEANTLAKELCARAAAAGKRVLPRVERAAEGGFRVWFA